MFEGFNIMFPEGHGSFHATYECFPVSMLPQTRDRPVLEKGGKIIMPPSALDTLTRFNVEYPMLFKLLNHTKQRASHAGVLEFIADEGKCYLPHWLMENLLLKEGDLITIENISLPVATFSKFQPHSSDFLDITNPKAVLENALRNFACLTTGDVIAIQYNRKNYELSVLETRPGNAVSIIECDMNVEFEAPFDYKEPTQMKPLNELVESDKVFEGMDEKFAGAGVRLDGKKKKDGQLETRALKKALVRGVPDYDYKFGELKFDRSVKPISDDIEDEKTKGTEKLGIDGFCGMGFSMNN